MTGDFGGPRALLPREIPDIPGRVSSFSTGDLARLGDRDLPFGEPLHGVLILYFIGTLVSDFPSSSFRNRVIAIDGE